MFDHVHTYRRRAIPVWLEMKLAVTNFRRSTQRMSGTHCDCFLHANTCCGVPERCAYLMFLCVQRRPMTVSWEVRGYETGYRETCDRDVTR